MPNQGRRRYTHDSLFDLFSGHVGHFYQLGAGSRVDHIERLAIRATDPFAVDEAFTGDESWVLQLRLRGRDPGQLGSCPVSRGITHSEILGLDGDHFAVPKLSLCWLLYQLPLLLTLVVSVNRMQSDPLL